MVAAEQGHGDVVSQLLAAGADVHLRGVVSPVASAAKT